MNDDEAAEELGWGLEPGRYFPETQETSRASPADPSTDRRAVRLGLFARVTGLATVSVMAVLGVLFVAVAYFHAGGLWTQLAWAALVVTAVLGVTAALLRTRLQRLRDRTGYPVAVGILEIVREAHLRYLGIGELIADKREQLPVWRLGQRKQERQTEQYRRQTWQKVLDQLEAAERARHRGDRDAWIKHNAKTLRTMRPFFGES